jgi:hypothetical protein
VRYALSPCTKQIRFVFEGLMYRPTATTRVRVHRPQFSEIQLHCNNETAYSFNYTHLIDPANSVCNNRTF